MRQDVCTMKTPTLASVFLLAAIAAFGATATNGTGVVVTPVTPPPGTTCTKTGSKDSEKKKESEKKGSDKKVEKKEDHKKVEKKGEKKDDDKWPAKRS